MIKLISASYDTKMLMGAFITVGGVFTAAITGAEINLIELLAILIPGIPTGLYMLMLAYKTYQEGKLIANKIKNNDKKTD